VRVGLVLEQFDPRRGGLEHWTTQFATELLARGHEVHVVAKRFGERSRAMPIVAHRLEGVHSAVGFATAAQEKLLQLGPDVIHDMGSGWFCDILHPHGGSLAAMARWKPLMVPAWLRPLKGRIDALLPRYRNFRRIARRQYIEDGRLVIALSRMVAEDFQRFHGVPSEQIRLVYNGVDTERFSPERRVEYRKAVRRWLGVDDDTLLLLIVTHNFRLKGVPTLMKAMRRLAGGRRPVHLAVVGGRQSGNYARAAALMGISNDITFVGSVDDTVPYYAAADVYTHPTLYDSCSLVVLEAMASGLPVITTLNNGAGELISEGSEGLVLPEADDVDGLVERIRTLAEPSVRREMGQSARTLALKHTLRRNVDQMLDVYEEVVANRAKAAASSTLYTRVPGDGQPADSQTIVKRTVVNGPGQVTRRREVSS
jgi:UDP-glucose:(heptosyl)LPS alpha-1,3-glucosyltransferase